MTGEAVNTKPQRAGDRMEAFYHRLMVRAATIDELLTDAFEPLPGQKDDADVAARRLAAWCRSCAGGDWALFERRLERDGLSIGQVLARFATVRRKASAPTPVWIEDTIWIEAALTGSADDIATTVHPGAYAFEHLFASVVEEADARLWVGIDPRIRTNLTDSARASLRHLLLNQLCDLCGSALYQRYIKAKNSSTTPSPESEQSGSRWHYHRFIAEMKAGGIRHLFEEKPVLARLIAAITRQWIDTSREFVTRLDADLVTIRQDLFRSTSRSRAVSIEGGLSDPHNGGHAVHIVRFEDGSQVVYKPKDLRLDAVWHDVVERLNRAGAPVDLRAARAIARDGYGWSEYIEHAGCTNQEGVGRFFRRAGAWLALFHCFVARDMHQENVIAAADHPVPIDVEVIFQGKSKEQEDSDTEAEAFAAAIETIDNSVSVVGLLPAYGRSADNRIFGTGGLNSEPISTAEQGWSNINSDAMRPLKLKKANDVLPNLPHVGGCYSRFRDHIEGFIDGFARYATFLMRLKEATKKELIENFAGLPVRKIVRSTQFYYMLLLRLKDHRTMGEGAEWSAQADFVARLADWSSEADVSWPLVRAERAAVLELNVPLFVSQSDGNEIWDTTGVSAQMIATSGMARVRSRLENMADDDIDWQIKVIRENTNSISRSATPRAPATELERSSRPDAGGQLPVESFLAEASKIAEEISIHSIRRGPGAAWIGRDYLGDSEVAQLAPLGPGMYNGVCGIAIFLAAHAAVTGHGPSGELALAAIAHLRKNLHGGNAASIARLLGIGGATGLGSIVYALTVTSSLLRNKEVLADAGVAAELFTHDLIAADKELDVVGGSAGGILGLLRLHRETQSIDALRRATRCGEHLVAQRRTGSGDYKSWSGQSSDPLALNGMSHGAAGFAYALASLSVATGREEFAEAASQCIAFENSSFDEQRSNWPDLRDPAGPSWTCQWCHGAFGIGIARIAIAKQAGLTPKHLLMDVEKALRGIERGESRAVDTLCCGTLGGVEFFCEAGVALGRTDLRDAALQRLMAVLEAAARNGDYRWNSGSRQFNLGLFRGLAGVGYTILRQVDHSLPNVLFWQ
jgi:type 2 lantibiotic biosynthesis protein LanM